MCLSSTMPHKPATALALSHLLLLDGHLAYSACLPSPPFAEFPVCRATVTALLQLVKERRAAHVGPHILLLIGDDFRWGRWNEMQQGKEVCTTFIPGTGHCLRSSTSSLHEPFFSPCLISPRMAAVFLARPIASLPTFSVCAVCLSSSLN